MSHKLTSYLTNNGATCPWAQVQRPQKTDFSNLFTWNNILRDKTNHQLKETKKKQTKPNQTKQSSTIKASMEKSTKINTYLHHLKHRRLMSSHTVASDRANQLEWLPRRFQNYHGDCWKIPMFNRKYTTWKVDG